MKKDSLRKKKNQLDSYIKYSSLAFQMGATIALFSWIGLELDEWQNTKQPYYTVAFSLSGVFLSLYLVITGLVNKKNDE
jgi:ATP synthase protein I